MAESEVRGLKPATVARRRSRLLRRFHFHRAKELSRVLATGAGK
jgi:hypothetical protein